MRGREAILAWHRANFSWFRLMLTGIVFAGLVFGIDAFARSAYFEAKLTNTLTRTIFEETELHLKLGAVKTGFEGFPPTLTLRAKKPVFTDPAYGEFARAEEIVVRPRTLSSLVTGFRIGEVVLRKPRVHLVIRHGKLRNGPRLRRRANDGTPNFPIDELAIESGAAHIEIDQRVFELKGLDTWLRYSENAVKAHIAATHVHVDADDIAFKPASLDWTGSVDLAEGLVSTTTSALKTEGLEIGINEAAVKLATKTSPLRYRGRVRVTVDADEVARFFPKLDLPPITGDVDVRGRVVGDGTHLKPDFYGDVNLNHVSIDGFGLGARVKLPIALKKNVLNIKAGIVDVESKGGQVQLSGSIDLRPPFDVNIRTKIAGLRIESLMHQLDVTSGSWVTWKITGNGLFKGTLAPLELEGPIDLKTRDFVTYNGAWHDKASARVIGLKNVSVKGAWAITEDAFRFNSLRFRTARSHFGGSVNLSFDDVMHAELHGSEVSLADAGPFLDIPIAGFGKVDCILDGKYERPSVKGSVALDNFAFGTFPVADAISTDFELSRDLLHLYLRKTEAKKRNSVYALSDIDASFAKPHFELTGKITSDKGVMLKDVYHAFHLLDDPFYRGLDAKITGRSSFTYTLGKKGDSALGTMSADFDGELSGIVAADTNFETGSVSGQWTWYDFNKGARGGDLKLRELSLDLGAGRIVLNGTSKRGQLDLTTVVDRIEASAFSKITDIQDIPNAIVSAHGATKGSIDKPRAYLETKIARLNYDGAHFGMLEGVVILADGDDPWFTQLQNQGDDCQKMAGTDRTPKVRYLGVCAALDDASFHGYAISRYPSFDDARGSIELDDADLSSIIAAVAGQETSGNTNLRMTGWVDIQDGNLLRGPTGSVVLSDVSLVQNGLRVRNHGAIGLLLQRGRVDIKELAFEGAGARLAVSGGVGLRTGYDLKATGALNLANTTIKLPKVRDLSGKASLNVSVKGKLRNPTLKGRLSVEDGQLAFSDERIPELKNLDGAVELSKNTLQIKKMTGKLGGGQISVTGRAILAGSSIRNWKVRTKARGVRLSPAADVKVKADAAVSLAGNTQSSEIPKLTGTVTLTHVNVTKGMQFSPTLGTLTSLAKGQVQQNVSAQANIKLDVQLKQRGPLKVVNDVINARLEIADRQTPFRIVGTDTAPGVLGKMRINQGTVQFRNSQLDIQSGLLRFRGRETLDVAFDVSAVTNVRRSDPSLPSWRVYLRAEGDLDNFNLRTWSNPALSEQDIALLLSTGMTMAEAQQLSAGDLGGTAAEALGHLTGINQGVSSILPVIDEFAVTSIYSTQTNRSEPHVRVGKRLGDNARVTATTGLTSASRTVQAQAELQLSQRTRLQLFYDNVNRESSSTFGNIGSGIRWRIEFE